MPVIAQPLPTPSCTAAAWACSLARSRWSRSHSAASRSSAGLAFFGLSFTTPSSRSWTEVRHQGRRIHADAGHHDPGERALRVDLVDMVRDVGVVTMFLFADPHVVVVLAGPPPHPTSPPPAPPP